MHGPPDKRNPTAMARGGARKLIGLAGLITPEDSENLTQQQARRLSRRFGLSWSTARAVASLAYGRPGS